MNLANHFLSHRKSKSEKSYLFQCPPYSAGSFSPENHLPIGLGRKAGRNYIRLTNGFLKLSWIKKMENYFSELSDSSARNTLANQNRVRHPSDCHGGTGLPETCQREPTPFAGFDRGSNQPPRKRECPLRFK